MKPAITFVIPVRHQDNASDWTALSGRLAQTARSIAAQSVGTWRAVVVANAGANLPDLPDGFSIERVDFAPNELHDISANDREKVYDSFRLDKGRRVLKGMLAAKESNYFMIVDDDDLVSARLGAFVADQPGANGWKIERGWVWGEGSGLVMQHNAFNRYCGTSLIIRSDLYGLPNQFEEASENYIKTMLGSHVRIDKLLEERGAPLEPLPFRGAVYRVGHSGAHSKSEGLLKSHVFNRTLLRHPLQMSRNVARLRLIGPAMRSEFFQPA